MPLLEVNGQTIYYQIYGEGRPCLLMHGWMDVGADLADLAGVLVENGYRVIVPDLPGYGQSVPPKRTYPVDFYQRDCDLMAEFLQVMLALLGERNAHIFGFSDGGEVALLMPLTNPTICRSVIAWGALGAFDQSACEHSRANSLPPDWVDDAITRKHPDQDPKAWTYQWVEAFCAMVAAGGDLSLSRAHLIECPLLLMLGENDRLNPPELGRRFVAKAAERPGVLRQFRTFKDAGHSIHIQQSDAFYAAVLEFLLRIDRR